MVRNINRRWKRRHFAKLIWSQHLRDFDNPGLTTLKIGDRDCAVAGAEGDTKAETSVQGWKVVLVEVPSVRRQWRRAARWDQPPIASDPAAACRSMQNRNLGRRCRR